MLNSFDIIIVGGGVVGLTTALALAHTSSLQIALLDSKKLSSEWNEGDYDFRVSAISPATQHIFENVGVWNSMQNKRVSLYDKMQVWDESGSEIDFDSKNVHENLLGHIVENNVMQGSLLEKISFMENVFLYDSASIVEIQKNNDSVVVITENQKLQCKLLIAADGGNSWVREQVGITLEEKDYQHIAIVANVRTELPHAQTARQKFLASGPLAFLPLSDSHSCSIVWSVTHEEAKKLLSQSDAEFCKSLTNSNLFPLGVILSVTARYQFPLRMQHAKNYVQSRLALIGDAAHTIHPLAGQGVNMGLLDAAWLVEIITEAVRKNRDFASLSTLRRYERFRKSDNALMLHVVDGLKKIFASQSKQVKSWRKLGLNIINKSNFLKNNFIYYAMGMRDEMPQLALSKKKKHVT